MTQNDIGLIGLAVMGQNLVLNMERNGFSVSVYNRTASKTKNFVEGPAAGKAITATYSPKELVASLERPRKIMIMVKAGWPVDAVIEELVPLLEPGDLIIDGGNSFFMDTERRAKELEEKGLLFIGTGVSGGEEGALWGPSMMPGGQKEAYELVRPIFEAIAAKVDGEPCVTYLGPRGAGHYVKMVHNGIEYGDIQLIAESYDILHRGYRMDYPALHHVFSQWNEGLLQSYLIEIAAAIFDKKDDETGKYVVDVILDAAGQKGTGKWTSQNALDLGIPATTITEAVFARALSAHKEERVAASQVLSGPDLVTAGDKDTLVPALEDALYASKVISYAQGFSLMRAASDEYGYDLNYGEIARIWRGGCIIRAAFLNDITAAFQAQPDLSNLLLAPFFRDAVVSRQKNWRIVLKVALDLGIPAPAMSASLAYFDGYRSERLPANMIQALRDYFGAHTYERVDKPRGQSFHTEWVASETNITAGTYNA